MNIYFKSIEINDAVSQYARKLEAQVGSAAPVDGRSLLELQSFAVQYGALINFYDLLDHPNGNWVDFFLADPSMVFASLETLAISPIESRFERLERQIADTHEVEARLEFVREAMRLIRNLAMHVDRWLIGLSLCNDNITARLMSENLACEIHEQLRTALQRLQSFDSGAESVFGLDWKDFSPIWELDSSATAPMLRHDEIRLADRIQAGIPELRPIFEKFVHAIFRFKTAHAHANDLETDSGSCQPQLGLYRAFTKLFRAAQNTINTFSSRYSEFYSHEVLREPKRGGTPDSAYVSFQLSPDEGVPAALIRQGTLFIARPINIAEERLNDIQEESLYAADRDLLVTNARISRILALRKITHRDPRCPEPREPKYLADPQPHKALGLLATEVLIEQESAFDSTAARERVNESELALPAWPTFGAERPGKTDITITQQAAIGFAISSEYLLLTGGRRHVTLTIILGQMPHLRANPTHQDDRDLSQGDGGSDLPHERIKKVFEDSFRFFASTYGGWFEIQSPEVVITTVGKEPVRSQASNPPAHPSEQWLEGPIELTISFDLDPQAPPLVGTEASQEDIDTADLDSFLTEDPAVLATNPAPTLPTLKAVLQPNIAPNRGLDSKIVKPLATDGSPLNNAIHTLADWQIENLSIDVDVRDLENLQLQNTDGTIATGEPFPVFGGLPTLGSSLTIHHSELFSKQLSALSIGIEWFNLPADPTGFTGYYRDYVIGLDGVRVPKRQLFDNQKFHVTIDVQSPGSWTLPLESRQPSPPKIRTHELFRTQLGPARCGPPQKDGKLCHETRFEDLPIQLHSIPDYYQPSDSALKIRLAAPDYAFGNDLYAENVLNAVIDDLPDSNRCNDQCLAECRVFSTTANQVDQILLECIELSDPVELQHCLVAKLAAAVQKLCTTTIQRFLRCIRHHQSDTQSPDNDAFKRLEESLFSMVANIREDPRNLAEELNSRIDKLLRKYPDFQECWNSTKHFRHAAELVVECIERLVQLDPPSRDQEVRCVTRCRTELESAHETCLKACIDACMQAKSELNYPNEPYLPQAEKVLVGYQASCEVQAGSDCLQFFDLLPFAGYQRLQPAEGQCIPLIPDFADGTLYLGFSGLDGQQTLTLLFQMEARSHQACDGLLPELTWSYLSENRWQTVGLSVLSDTTNGLQGSGIVTLGVPSFCTLGNTILPDTQRWLRVTAKRHAGRFPATVQIAPHAVSVTLTRQDTTQGHRLLPLPAQSISAAVEDLPDISSIVQPMESFGGRNPETNESFHVRLSERLRHKDRANLSWDYERMILERFPEIWKVQTLPAQEIDRTHSPGSVVLVVVPGPNSQQTLDPTAPTASTALLSSIESFLRDHVSPFVNLQVVNPNYVRVTVETSVEFLDALQSQELVERLNGDLVEYLSPWFYDVERATKAGRYTTPANVREFIQSRPYVTSVQHVKLHPGAPGCRQWYFLTSAKEHLLHVAGLANAGG